MASIDLGAPLRGGKDGYLQHFFITRQNFSQLLTSIPSIRDPRISLFTDFMISSVTDEDTREELYGKKQQYYDELIEALDDHPTEDEKALCLAQACMKVLGDITSWFDDFLAITHSQTFGVCGELPGEDEDEARFGGGDPDGNIDAADA